MLKVLLTLGFLLFYLILPRILKKKIDWKKSFPNALLMGVAVGFLAVVFGILITDYFPSLIASKIRAILLAPLIEEALKFYGILRYLQKREPTAESIRFGYGYGVGLGFGILETFSAICIGENLFGISLRVTLTMPMHIIVASLSAYGIGQSFKADGRLYYSLFFLGLAVVIHMIFNLVAFHLLLEFQRLGWL